MSGGYGTGKPPTELAGLITQLEDIERRLDTLERPSGEQLAQVVEELTALVNDIQTQLDDYIATGTYTKAQIDNLVANPPGNVSVAGTITANYGGNFPAGLRSTGAYGTNVTGGGAYAAAWIHNDGRIGFAPSSRRFKTDIRQATFSVDDVLKLQGFFFRYLATVPFDPAQQRINLNLLAEDTHRAGFPWLVEYRDGKPFGVDTPALAVVLLEGFRSLVAEVRGSANNS